MLWVFITAGVLVVLFGAFLIKILLEPEDGLDNALVPENEQDRIEAEGGKMSRYKYKLPGDS